MDTLLCLEYAFSIKIFPEMRTPLYTGPQKLQASPIDEVPGLYGGTALVFLAQYPGLLPLQLSLQLWKKISKKESVGLEWKQSIV